MKSTATHAAVDHRLEKQRANEIPVRAKNGHPAAPVLDPVARPECLTGFRKTLKADSGRPVEHDAFLILVRKRYN